MSAIKPVLEGLLQQSESFEKFEVKMQQNGVQKHFRTSYREGLLGTRAFIDTLAEVLDETDQDRNNDSNQARKINVSE